MYARTKGHFEIVGCTGKLHEVRETENQNQNTKIPKTKSKTKLNSKQYKSKDLTNFQSEAFESF